MREPSACAGFLRPDSAPQARERQAGHGGECGGAATEIVLAGWSVDPISDMGPSSRENCRLEARRSAPGGERRGSNCQSRLAPSVAVIHLEGQGNAWCWRPGRGSLRRGHRPRAREKRCLRRGGEGGTRRRHSPKEERATSEDAPSLVSIGIIRSPHGCRQRTRSPGTCDIIHRWTNLLSGALGVPRRAGRTASA